MVRTFKVVGFLGKPRQDQPVIALIERGDFDRFFIIRCAPSG